MAGRGGQPQPRTRRTRLFAACVPGLGRMLRRQLDAIDGIDVTGTGSDGLSDLVFFEADRDGRAYALASRLAEDIFAEIGRASRAGRLRRGRGGEHGLAAGRCPACAVGLGG